MSSPSVDEFTVVRVFRKRVSKTVKIENFSLLQASEKISLDILLDSDTYILNIEAFHGPNLPTICLTIEHKNNTKQLAEFKVTLMDKQGMQFYQKVDVLKPTSYLTMNTRYTVRDLPFGCLIVRYELSCISWSETDDMQKKTMSFSRMEDLSRDFGELYAKQTNADVVLQVGNSEILVHSQILSARSEVFAAMFGHDMSEKRNRTVLISDVGAMAMHYFLIYIYTGKLDEMKDLRQDIIIELYSAADKYAVSELKEMCSDFMLSKISIDSVTSYAEVAYRHSDSRIQDAVIDFVMNKTEILDSKQWRELEDSMPAAAAEVLKAVCKRGQ